MFDLLQISGLNITLYIILFGAVILYFGKIIGDKKVESYDKMDYYIEGLFFFIWYILLPLILAFYVQNMLNLHVKDIFDLYSLLLFFIQLLVIGVLSLDIDAILYLRRLGLLAEVEKSLEEQISEIKIKKPFLGPLINFEGEWLKKTFRLTWTELVIKTHYLIPLKYFVGKKVLFLFSFLTILCNFYFYNSGILLIFGLSLIFTFVILTLIATAYGFSEAHYPPTKIYMKSGEIIEGKALKFGDFVYLVKEDKKIFINTNEIDHFEESLFREKDI
jgi:hypothetical protein